MKDSVQSLCLYTNTEPDGVKASPSYTRAQSHHAFSGCFVLSEGSAALVNTSFPSTAHHNPEPNAQPNIL